MITDRQGNALKGATAEAAAAYDDAVEAFNLYAGDPLALLDRAIEAAPEFAMARIAKAHVLALATEPAASAAAAAIVAETKALPLGERERLHVAALEQLCARRWTDAAATLDRLNARWPHDLLALQAGHLIDFYRAASRHLRDRIARVLPHWSEAIPGYAVLLGMYAFGLEESGDYARAEDTGRRAVALEPRDCWAHHAVAHVMEMQGRAEDGIGWMIAREAHWAAEDNFFKIHNWWHRALFHLDLGEVDEALALYDGPVRESRSAVALDLVDAAALLWRLELLGHDVGDRWVELAATWDRHADGATYAFNDWHAAMAYLGAGREHDVERLLAAYRRAAAEDDENGRWARTVGRPLIEGFAAFRRGRYAAAVEHLYGMQSIVNAFGGSNAQRDVIDWTLAEAAVRSGQAELAEALAHARLAAKPLSRVNRRLLARSRTRSRAAA